MIFFFKDKMCSTPAKQDFDVKIRIAFALQYEPGFAHYVMSSLKYHIIAEAFRRCTSME